MAALEAEETQEATISWRDIEELQFLTDPFIERLPHGMALDIFAACFVASEAGILDQAALHKLLEHTGVFEYLMREGRS